MVTMATNIDSMATVVDSMATENQEELEELLRQKKLELENKDRESEGEAFVFITLSRLVMS